MSRGAVFLDRDGTIIEDRAYVRDPADVVLLPGAAAAIARLNAARVPVVVVTNQSGIARGMFGDSEYERVAARIGERLAEGGARIDATFMCPHHPDFTGPCECRKPGTLLYRRAAAALGLDLGASWYVGDRLRDVLPARTLGGVGILIPSEATPADDLDRARREFAVLASLDEAADRVIQSVQ